MTKKIKNSSDKIQTDPFIIGIGASAGGLEAINEFFDNMPPNTGFSFIVVQHLSPDYKSLMAELLAKHTPMHVIEATQDMKVQPNCIYLIPTKKMLTIENGKLQLHDKPKNHQPNTAIDIFFESLAKDRKDKAVGIILSGTGSDGTKGIEAIKQQGGVVIVQDPQSAEFDGMPSNAIATGSVDLVLSPQSMPGEMIEYLKEAPFLHSFNLLNNEEESLLMDILELVYKTTGHNFSHYKRPTLTRRIAKRMAEKNIQNLTQFYKLLSEDAEEVKALCRGFLINVTRFFRDEDAFDVIRKKVIPDLVSKKSAGDTIKIWVVGASSGEEAYSLAMLFDEYLEQQKKTDINIKIFATDIHHDSIEKASKGLYNAESVKEVPADKLKRFFIRENNQYRIIPSLRKAVVFAKHDVSKDPPFSKIDFLTCRNMLIYMNPTLQKNILYKFHFSLNEEGYLFLGPSENIGALKDVMKDVDKKWKIYKCLTKEKLGQSETFLNLIERGNIIKPQTPKVKNALAHLADIFKETVLEESSYAGIFIDKDFEVKQAIGDFKKFMKFPEKDFNFNLLKLVSHDLSVVLSTSVRKAIKSEENVVVKRVKIEDRNNEKWITVIVKPYLNQKNYLQSFVFIVLKEETTIEKAAKIEGYTSDEYAIARISELESELKETKESLQAVIEEIESANEELQSSNEEIISSNEELQSTNEELQSLNEELHTVNTEHQSKIKELIELNDDLNNYFNNTDIGQILVDKNLIIRKFSPAVAKQVNIIESDIGRSITHLSTNFKTVDLGSEIKEVINTKKASQKEIVLDDHNIFLLRIAPYIRQDKTISGAVINFIDVSESKKLTSILEAVFNSSTSGISAKRAIRDEAGKIIDFEFIAVNKTAEKIKEGEAGSFVGKRMMEKYPKIYKHFFDSYVQVVETGKPAHFEFYNEESERWYDVVCVKMMDGLVTTYTDITDKRRAADLLALGYEKLKATSHILQKTNDELERSNYDLLQFASVASHDLKEPLRKIQAFGNLLKERLSPKIDPTEKNYLDKIINSSHRMQVLIDDILSLSKLSNYEIPKTEVNLNEIIHRITDDLEVTIKEKAAKIEVDKLPVIEAIPGQMHQLFQNLVSNALKFNESDHPSIKVKQKKIDKALSETYAINPENFVCITVEDNGIGFEEKYSEKIFGIFQRLDGTNYKGTGIGLAICKKIVENHNGLIKADSKPGKGSVFTILLPKESNVTQGTTVSKQPSVKLS